jgi:hypothetical protein
LTVVTAPESTTATVIQGEAAVPAAALLAPSWIDALIASEVFVAQQKMVGRAAPAEEQLRRLLALLDERKGTAITSTVAQRLNVPEFRVSSIVAAARRVLNVEGYSVISFDDGAKTLTLNFDLLRAQFGLEE